MEMGSKQQRDKEVSKQQPSGEGDTKKKRKPKPTSVPTRHSPTPSGTELLLRADQGPCTVSPAPPNWEK